MEGFEGLFMVSNCGFPLNVPAFVFPCNVPPHDMVIGHPPALRSIEFMTAPARKCLNGHDLIRRKRPHELWFESRDREGVAFG